MRLYELFGSPQGKKKEVSLDMGQSFLCGALNKISFPLSLKQATVKICHTPVVGAMFLFLLCNAQTGP